MSEILKFFKKQALYIDQSIIFDPARWPYREAVSRCTALLVVSGFIVLRFHGYESFPQFFQDARQFYGGFMTAEGVPLYSELQISAIWGIKLAVWIIETAIFLGYIASYASRVRAVKIAKGFMEVAFPFIVAGLPVLISLLPYSLPRWLPVTSGYHAAFYVMIMGLIVLGGMINLVGLLTMRKAFTIMSEARTLITRGIFNYVRHPLYAGHFIMFFGSMLLRLQAASIALYLIFLITQIVRAHIEERKLLAAFDEYEPYRRQTGMFWPRWRQDRPGRD